MYSIPFRRLSDDFPDEANLLANMSEDFPDDELLLLAKVSTAPAGQSLLSATQLVGLLNR